VRERTWGRWATEILIPHTRLGLWIDRFRHALEAALAYDATMFCFYGECLPRQRKFNFPAVQRPAIPDHLRIHLTIATVRAIAANYGRRCAAFLAPLVCCAVPGALSAPPLMATVPGTDGAGATAGVEAAALTDDHHGNNKKYFFSCLGSEQLFWEGPSLGFVVSFLVRNSSSYVTPTIHSCVMSNEN